MTECTNCGAVVTKDYERVFVPEDADGPRVCPRCPDMTRVQGKAQPARANRR